jgi:hypothetical protein
MEDNKNKGSLVSSFSYPVHQATKTTSSFTVSSHINREVDTKWLIDTSSQAARLGTQRSNVELLCLFTCCNKAKEFEDAGTDGPSHGNEEWIKNINTWSNNNKTLALQSGYISTYFKKYGFALYQNVASDRFDIALCNNLIL